MALSVSSASESRVRLQVLRVPQRHAAVLGALGLVLVAVGLRTRGLAGTFWIDDGISTGIASHPLREIPGVLAQDGAPPLYYGLLHLWMQVAGTSDRAVYALSVLFAVACVPAAWWAGRTLFDPRTGWACAALAAVSPYLTEYAGHARMYTLLALLSLLSSATFVRGFVHRDRRWLPACAAALAALLYTHIWGAFVVTAAALAVICCAWTTAPGAERRGLLRDGALVFAAVGVAFLPWLPTVLGQAAHTGAPWSLVPGARELVHASLYVVGAAAVSPLLLAAAAGWAGERRDGRPDVVVGAVVLGVLAVVPLLLGWVSAHLGGGWASRYVAVAVGPAILLVGAGLVRAGRLGLLVALLTALTWGPPARVAASKSNVAEALQVVGPALGRGELVLSTAPEQVPVVRRYLGGAPRYASTFGLAADPLVMDWRDALARLRRTPASTLRPLLDGVAPQGRVVVVRPSGPVSAAPWQRLVHLRNRQWLRVLRADRRFQPVARSARGRGAAQLAPVVVLVFRRNAQG